MERHLVADINVNLVLLEALLLFLFLLLAQSQPDCSAHLTRGVPVLGGLLVDGPPEVPVVRLRPLGGSPPAGRAHVRRAVPRKQQVAHESDAEEAKK